MTDSPSAMPASHEGLAYWHFLADLTKKRGVKRYLEVGVQQGQLMSMIQADRAVGVDPFFNITFNVAKGKKQLSLFQGPSDEFFASGKSADLLGGAPDFVFLDGMHTFDYLLRDFYHSEALAAKDTLIALHDCLPLGPEMIERSEARAVAMGAGSRFPGYWTGDVWKLVPILKEYRPDLKIVCVDSAPTGLVFISNLDPGSRVLSDNYLEIVGKYAAMGNDLAALDRFYASVQLVKTARILNEFDHSLYFRT